MDLLTGDNEKVAKKVSDELKMDGFLANVLPHDKLEKVKELQEKGEYIAMTGDGVNDAPALAQADVGIAVGSGTDVAAETADIILVNSDPKDIANLILFGKATYSKMIQNLWWAAGYNIIAIPLAAGVLYQWNIMLSPAVGAVLMSLSTIVVAINAQLLKRKLMIEKIISWSTHNRFFVWIGILLIVVGACGQ
jgi:Cu2+-exporting ATPase